MRCWFCDAADATCHGSYDFAGVDEIEMPGCDLCCAHEADDHCEPIPAGEHDHGGEG